MEILLIGNGHKYKHDIRCIPSSEAKLLITDKRNILTNIDISPSVEPDFVADVTKENWWESVPGKYDIIIDTIGPLGPHINHTNKIYCISFIKGCTLLLAINGTFYGFYPQQIS